MALFIHARTPFRAQVCADVCISFFYFIRFVTTVEVVVPPPLLLSQKNVYKKDNTCARADVRRRVYASVIYVGEKIACKEIS